MDLYSTLVKVSIVTALSSFSLSQPTAQDKYAQETHMWASGWSPWHLLPANISNFSEKIRYKLATEEMQTLFGYHFIAIIFRMWYMWFDIMFLCHGL